MTDDNNNEKVKCNGCNKEIYKENAAYDDGNCVLCNECLKIFLSKPK